VSGGVVSPELRDRVRGVAVPVALAFGRLGLTPNALTLIGFAIAVAAAAAASQQGWFLAGVLVIVGGVFDLFDGALARATNKVSRLGAFMDSVFDRAGEAIVYIGIAFGCMWAGFGEGAVLAAAALAASMMVSYTRAKSESLGFTTATGMANVGMAPREIRLVILTLGLIFAPTPLHEAVPVGAACAGACDFPQGGSLGIALLVITTLATITTIQRIVHVTRQTPPEATPGGDQHS
jgi:phosphatidylglycerophosphate synthase